MNPDIVKAIAVTAELTGTEMSKIAVQAMEADLSRYPADHVMRALSKCRRELRGRLTLSDVLTRIEAQDGRPTPDEAWAVAITALDEAETVVWSTEIAQAWGVAEPLIRIGDKVAARRAFIDAYERIAEAARDAGAPSQWVISLGHDPDRRVLALNKAVEQGRIAQGVAMAFLPAPLTQDGAALAGAALQLIDKSQEFDKEEARKRLREAARTALGKEI